MDYEQCAKCSERIASGEKVRAISQNIPGGVEIEREVLVGVAEDGVGWRHQCLVCDHVWIATEEEQARRKSLQGG